MIRPFVYRCHVSATPEPRNSSPLICYVTLGKALPLLGLPLLLSIGDQESSSVSFIYPHYDDLDP